MQNMRVGGPAKGKFSLRDSLVKWRRDCPTCGKVLKSTYKMLHHVKTLHQEIREYRCKLCDRWFKTNNNLLEHIGTKHMGLTAKEYRSHPETPKHTRNGEYKRLAKNHEAFEYIPKKTLLEIAKEIKAQSLT